MVRDELGEQRRVAVGHGQRDGECDGLRLPTVLRVERRIRVGRGLAVGNGQRRGLRDAERDCQ